MKVRCNNKYVYISTFWGEPQKLVFLYLHWCNSYRVIERDCQKYLFLADPKFQKVRYPKSTIPYFSTDIGVTISKLEISCGFLGWLLGIAITMSLDIVVFFFRKRSFSTWIGEGEGDICFQFVASNWAIAGVHPRNKDIVFLVKVNIVGNKDKVNQWCWLSSKFSKFCKCRRFGNVDDEHLPFISFLTTLSRWHYAAKMIWDDMRL